MKYTSVFFAMLLGAHIFAQPVTGIVLTNDTCRGQTGDNIFLNGDFGSGAANILPFDPGYAPGYVYEFNPPPNDGTYTITNNTTPWGSFAADSWINIGDNSSDPNGYMMVVNASTTPGLFYQQNVAVCENTPYQFSAEVISMNVPAIAQNFVKPNLTFLINGAGVFSSGDVPIDSAWHTYGFSFVTQPGVEQLTLALRNNAPGGSANVGNDLAIDNISFRICADAGVNATPAAVCTGENAVMRAVLNKTQFPNPALQWQESADGGATWTDLPGQTDTSLLIANPASGRRYRFLLAGSAANLSKPACRIASTSNVTNVRDTFVTRKTLRLCRGALVNGAAVSKDTVFTELFQTVQHCDSTLVTTLQVLPVYDQTFNLTLCRGKSLYGLPVFSDTTLFFKQQTAAGCDSISTVKIKIETLTGFSITGKANICQGEKTALSAGTFSTYQWSTGAQTSGIQVDKAGMYAVTVSSANGCTASDTVQIDVTVLSFIVLDTDPSCAGAKNGRLSVGSPAGGTGPYLYALAGGGFQGNPVFQNLGAGVYAVRIQDAAGCEHQQSVALNEPPELALSLGSDVVLAPGDSIRLQVATNKKIATYLWQPAKYLSCSDCPAPVARPLLTTRFTLTAIDTSGCRDSTQVVIAVKAVHKIYAPNVFSPDKDGSNNFFTLFTGKEASNIRRLDIFDRWGNYVFSAANALPGAETLQWDGSFRDKKLNPDIFTWIAEIEFSDGKTEVFTGDVLLLR